MSVQVAAAHRPEGGWVLRRSEDERDTWGTDTHTLIVHGVMNPTQLRDLGLTLTQMFPAHRDA